MRSHQAEGMTRPLMSAGGSPQQPHEVRPIVVVLKQESGSCYSARVDVEVSIREAGTGNARHAATVSARLRSVVGWGQIGALLWRLQCQAL